MTQVVPSLSPGEEAIPAGIVISSYTRLRVAAINPSIRVNLSDTLVFQPQNPCHDHRECRITVSSLQIDHRPVETVEPGQLCGVELGCSCRQLPRNGDTVWLVRQAIAGVGSDERPVPLVESADNDDAC